MEDKLRDHMDRLTMDTATALLLDKVEKSLHASGKSAPATALMELQKDAADYFARCDDPSKPMTVERFNTVLKEAYHGLQDGDLKTSFGQLLQEMLIPQTLSLSVRPSAPGR